MAKAVHVGNQTAHGVPLTGNGSSNVFINGKPAWRAIPAGVGDGLEDATKAIKKIMDKPLFAPPDVAPDLPKIQAKMLESATKAAQAQNPAAVAGVTTACVTLTTTTVALTAAYTAGAAVPGGEPAARSAFTMGFKAALSSAAGAAVTAIGGSWDMHTCSLATPNPHGPGLMTRGAETVFINGFRAAIDEEVLFEATQGPVGVSTPSQNVFIGKGVSFGGGDGGGSGSGGRLSQSKSSPSKSSQNKKQNNEQAADSPVEEPKRDKLWVRVAISPKAAGKDRFVLTSTDGSVNSTKTAADDKIPNNDSIDLLFDELDTSLSYTLKVIAEDGTSTMLFENVAHADLNSLQGEPEEEDQEEDLGEYSGPVEQIRATRGEDDQ